MEVVSITALTHMPHFSAAAGLDIGCTQMTGRALVGNLMNSTYVVSP